MLVGYFDDSRTHNDPKIIVWAGFVGAEDQWAGLTTVWIAKLAAPLPGKPPLRSFHMSKCEARDGEFADYNVAEKDAVIHDFRQLIIDFERHGSGIRGRKNGMGSARRGCLSGLVRGC